MTTTYLSPILNDAQFNDDGTFLVGGLIWFYAAGTSTPLAAYTGPNTTTPWSNPIVLDARGEAGGQIWLDSTASYKMVLESPPFYGDIHGVVISTFDNINGVYVPGPETTISSWMLYSGIPSRLTNTSFSVSGDHRDIFQFNRRLKSLNSAGYIYSTVKNAVYSSGVTNVTVVNDSGALDSGLSAVYYSFVDTNPSSIPRAVLLGSNSTTTSDNIYLSQSAGRLQQAVNTASPSSNWPIDVTGNVTGNVSGNVTGNLTGNVTGNVTGTLTGNVSLPDGNNLSPSIYWTSERNTGFSKYYPGIIDVSILGSRVASFGIEGIISIPGNGTNPGYSFVGETNTGFSKFYTGLIDVSIQGNHVASFGLEGVLTKAGNNVTPGYTFIGETGTGFSKYYTGLIDVSILTTRVASFGLEGVLAQQGSAYQPSFAFIGDTHTGFSSAGGGVIRVSSSGTQVAECNSSGLSSIPIIGGALSRATTIADFGRSFSTHGYQKLPSGMILQWGYNDNITGGLTLTVTFPIPFPTSCLCVTATTSDITTPLPITANVTGGSSCTLTKPAYYATGVAANSAVPSNVLVNWIAIGF